MKYLSLIIITFSFLSQSFGQWTPLNSGTNYQLQEVYFINQDTGFVVGLDKVFKTTDGGSSWQVSHNGSQIVSGVYFTNDTNGYVVGIDVNLGNTVILRTTDTGNSWQVTNLTSTENLVDVFFLNDNIGFAVGSSGTALKTIDGGNNWSLLNTGTTSILNSIYFTDTQNGIIVGGPVTSPLILKTSDGGTTWSTITSSATDFLQSVFFPSSLIGYIVGWSGDILKTTDGGNNWIIQTPAAVSGNLDVFFTDNLTGYIVGGSTNFTGIQKTIDGGQTWTTQSASTSAGLIGVHFPTPGIGYAVGDNGTILKTINGGAVGIENTIVQNFNITTYPNPFIDEITISSDRNTSKMNITIFNLMGEIIYQTISINSEEKVNLASLNSGTYFVVIKTDEGEVVRKIIKR
jgi:photosystem II stability/assembly factor-like uncharacterized protein